MAKSDFTFDDWKNLASTDSEAFEQKRDCLIRNAISKAPKRYHDRLTRLQWRVDMERKRHGNPLSSCIHLSQMMMDSVYGDHGLLDALNGAKQELGGEQQQKSFVVAKVFDLNSQRQLSAKA